MKIKLTLFLLLPFVLVGCDKKTTNTVETTNTDHGNLLESVSEEEQFKISDVVCLATYNHRAHTERYENIVYTIYYINVSEMLKGNNEVTYVYLRGDTTKASSMSTSVDEIMNEDKTYKLFLKEKDGKYFTTAGYQSIIEQ